MSTTTLRIDAALKARIAAGAKRHSTSAHNYLLERIAESVAQDELRAEFERSADEGEKEILATGMGLDWSETKAWLRARVRGTRAAPPRAKKIANLK